MTNTQWSAFSSFRDRFRDQCAIWSAQANGERGDADWLKKLQQAAADSDGNVAYPLQTPIVYNTSLDALAESDEIKLIVVGDNPGKDEQLEKNRKYLVGQAGKLGDGFFRKNPDLGIHFRENVIILNKTPIHTAKTKQLSYMLKNGGPAFSSLFEETQRWMARETAEIQKALGCGLWLVGYGELREKGLFAAYADELKAQYRDGSGNLPRAADQVRLYQHFSMNRFSIDLADRYDGALDLGANLKAIGLAHRVEILGW
jgi:hypothetical protein